MSNQANSLNKGLTVKDLVTTGIFTALVFVFVLVGGIFFAPNPVLTFFMPAGSGLLAGHYGRCHLYYLVRYGYALGFCAGLSDYGGGR